MDIVYKSVNNVLSQLITTYKLTQYIVDVPQKKT